MISDERLRELLARGYEQTKGVTFAEYVRARRLDQDGEEEPMLAGMRLASHETLVILATAVKKFAPDLASELSKRWGERKAADDAALADLLAALGPYVPTSTPI